MSTFPESLKFLAVNNRFEVSPEVARTEFASNSTRQRLKFKTRNDQFHVSCVTDDAGLAEFESFVADEISNGADSFDVEYYDCDIPTLGAAYIVDGEYEVAHLGNSKWRISMTLEIIDRSMENAQNIYELVNAYGGFCELNDFAQIVEDVVNGIDI